MGGPFASKSFNATRANSIAAKYRRLLQKRPFLLFGLPFLTTIVGGSFMLTPATALRYERHDKKNQRMSQDEALGIGKNRRKVDMKEEFYRLQAKDIDNWEQKRVKRLKGEIDGILE
ncbi:cytochrome c oxidase assembly protein COX16, mitochondrial [Polyplosphaeria fusca]|uniref:Cytochrome c oxidase assembly protein COX16, mitochondrial n=1 Tax=Polyplosphaeria fusca TaxID=682080 RepID=A0A9P4QY96_9PLEO|nr:cytochrome c oxidase assembly protein COX16, mitochondrial [Polyplosphaeria fusca]